MAYQSKHTGTAIDNGIDINTTQNNRLTTLETNYNSLNTYAHNLLVDNSIKTSYIQNQAVTEDKLADNVKDALSSIKIYSGTLKANNWISDLSTSFPSPPRIPLTDLPSVGNTEVCALKDGKNLVVFNVI